MHNLSIIQEAACGGAHQTDDALAIELDFGTSAVAVLHLPQGYTVFDGAGIWAIFPDFADALDWLCERR